MKILVVLSNRNIDVRKTYVQILERGGHEVVTASSGETALQIITDNNDLHWVITELNLPGEIDGLEVARQAVGRKISTVLTAGSFEEETLDEAYQLGIEAHMKPYVQTFLKERGVLTK